MKDRSVRKENDRLARGSEGSLHVPADGYVITECGGGGGGLRVRLASTRESGLHPESYLGASRR